jgi:hypothetical protein
MSTKPANFRIDAAVLVLILAPLLAGSLAQWCMVSGVGVSPDSVVYLSAADSVLAGEGLQTIVHHFTSASPSVQPLVGFPPTYPLLLSLSGSLSNNRLNGAKWLHIFLFAINIFLLGMIAYFASARSALATAMASLIALSSARFLEIQMMAWSEAPFVLFSLCAVLLIMFYIRSLNYLLLASAAVSTSLALTTRYAGVALLPPLVLTILLLGDRRGGRRIRDAAIFLCIAILPLGTWLLRNVIVVQSATRRTLTLRAVTISDLDKIVNALFAFELPSIGNIALKIAVLLFGAALLCVALVFSLKALRERELRADLNNTALLSAALFVVTYLFFLVLCNATMVPVIDFDTRTLVPVYIFGIILLISVMHRITQLRAHVSLRSAILVLSLVLISANAIRAWSFARIRHNLGSGFNSREWVRSETMNYVRSEPHNRILYSNGVDAIHFLTLKTALRIPSKFDPLTGAANAAFVEDMNNLRSELLQNDKLLIQFDRITWRWYLPAKEELENDYHLPVFLRLADGVVYGTAEPPITARSPKP